MTPLDPSGNDQYVGDFVLRTPGLTGVAEERASAGDDLRAEGDASSGVLDDALRQEDLRPQSALALRDTEEQPLAAGAETRAVSHGKPAIEVEAPAPAEGWEQVLLVSDEDGALSWHFAVDGPATGGGGADAAPGVPIGGESTRGTGRRLYVVPRAPARLPEGETRGVGGRGLVKLLRVVAFKLIDPVAGAVGPFFVRKWEGAKRPYSLRPVGPDDYRAHVVVPPEEAAWDRLGGGRALLFVHGTFSRSDLAFSALPHAFVRDLAQHYEGRVFAFDHFTLSEDPRANVRRFVEAMPDGLDLDLDIVAHSRGGLVTRLLAERADDFSLGARRITVRKAALVAVPSAGTLLADVKHVGTFIDAFTNLLTHVPDGFEPVSKAADVLAAVLTVLKHVAAGTVKGLDGLQAMRPGSPFLKDLNASTTSETHYYALAAQYEPTQFALQAFVKDRLADLIFGRADNDVVVPTEGVYAANDSSLFPIADRHVFAADAGVAHTTFFGQAEAQKHLRAWLTD